MNNGKLLTIVIFLQALILVEQWSAAPRVSSPAHAQIPDAGAVRLQILDEMKTLNGKVEKVIGILESGKLEVRTVAADDNKGGRR